jgi:hypothetical protein
MVFEWARRHSSYEAVDSLFAGHRSAADSRKSGFFDAIRYRFDREGIRHVDVETLAWAKDNREEVILSPLLI